MLGSIIVSPRWLEHGIGMSSAGLPYRFTSKGMRITMFQVSGSLDDFEHGFQGSGSMS